MEATDEVEAFYGVYLLKCLNPKYKGRTYIGYTVDPNRRIKQHNKGRQFGGAWRTSQKGPWEMTLTVHGFPSDVAALRFEWAWQHPKRSRRLKSIIANKKAYESSFDYCLKVMFTMLRTPPWSRLPLTVRWLSADVMVDPPPALTPPVHMPILYGPVVSKKIKSPTKKSQGETHELQFCNLCHNFLSKEDSLSCINVKCQSGFHVLCLAKRFLEKETVFGDSQSENSSNILPVEGSCPKCESVVLWGDLVRKKKGCYNQLTQPEGEVEADSVLGSED